MKQDRDDYRYHREFTPMTDKEYKNWKSPVFLPDDAYESLDKAKVTTRKWIVLALLVAALAAWILVKP